MRIFVVLLLIAVICNARYIQWTGVGGNPLWNNAGNWDCGCLPTLADDVVIDIQAIPGKVQIGGVIAAALCNSLTIGGSSRFSQTLTVTGALTIGSGGGSLHKNGIILVESSPTAPFSIFAPFTSRGGLFSFATGNLTGQGGFVFPQGTVLNFTGPAAKSISTKITVQGSAMVAGLLGTSLQIGNGGQLIIEGSFKTSTPLSISSDKTSTFSVVKQGSFVFTGPTLSIQGSADLGSWTLGASSTATIINTVNSGSLALTSGAVLTLIGAPTDKRTFNAITGAGTILNQGGTNVFTNLAAGSFVASGGVATINSGSVSSFQLTGSSVNGIASASLSAASATISAGTISGLSLSADSLTINGVVNINGDGTVVRVNRVGQISTSSQLTLSGGSSFVVSSGATVSQGGDFKFVQGPPSAQSPTIVVSGNWATTSNLAIFTIPVTGGGKFSISAGGSWSLTNVNFNAALVTVQGSLSLSQGVFNVSHVAGTGSISGSPSTFVAQYLETASFNLASGAVQVTNGSVTSLSVSGGTFTVLKELKVGTFTFVAGTVQGPQSLPTRLTAQSTILKGTTATLTNIQLVSKSIQLNCPASCQFFTNNAVVSTA